MTDIFNIDHEVEGFRRNNLDWRKLRDGYTKISISKLERGIKPLPLPLLLKLFGPQKLLNTYIVSRRVTNDLDYYYTAKSASDTCKVESEMRDKHVPRPVNFPGNTVLINSISSENGYSVAKSVQRAGKYDALPPRPVFQRHSHVPGRYFPKPPSNEELSIHSKSSSDSLCMSGRPRTITPRSRAYTPKNPPNSRGSSSRAPKSSTTYGLRNSGIIKGSVCKATEISRPWSFSGKSTSSVKSATSALTNDKLLISRKPINGPITDSDKTDVFSISFRPDDQGPATLNGGYDPQSEIHSDYYTVKRLRLSARQVSFPKGSDDFKPVLQGKPKTLHRRKSPESTEVLQSMKERSKTHVGFVDEGD